MLTVATDVAYPPQSFLRDDGSFDGFDVDVAQAIGKRLGVGLRFVTPDWSVILEGNWRGRWDVSVGSVTPTPERAKLLDFPAVYYYTPAAFAVHADNDAVTSVAELDGKTIGACRECTYEEYLNGTLRIDPRWSIPFEFVVKPGKMIVYETDLRAFDDLKREDDPKLAAVLSAMPTIQNAIARGYPLKVLGAPVFYEPLAIAIAKGDPEFAAKLEEVVGAMHEDGTLSRISRKWYGIDYTRAPLDQ